MRRKFKPLEEELNTIKTHSAIRDQRQDHQLRERLIEEVNRAKKAEAITQGTKEAKRRRLSIRAEGLRRYDAGVGRNIQPGQRASSIHVSHSATKGEDPSIPNSSSSENTESQPLVLDQAYDSSREEKDVNGK